MSLTRSLFNEFRPLFRLLDEPFSRQLGVSPRHFNPPSFPSVFNQFHIPVPAVDVSEDGNRYIIEAELPGVKKEDIQVHIGDSGRSLTIEGKTVQRSQPSVLQQAPQGEAAETSSEGNAVVQASSQRRL
jgi:HSP20 family molecular chaperone IbpA